jgi:hypothetical protein
MGVARYGTLFKRSSGICEANVRLLVILLLVCVQLTSSFRRGPNVLFSPHYTQNVP